jgi:hypothetical protein
MTEPTTTTQSAHGIQPGDLISLTVPDPRWWRRLAFWLLRKGPPQRTVVQRVSSVTNTTLTIDKEWQ